MSTIAGTFKVVQLGLDQNRADELAAKLGISSEELKKKLAGGALLVEQLPQSEYEVTLKDKNKTVTETIKY
jgi:hypothetical protein